MANADRDGANFADYLSKIGGGTLPNSEGISAHGAVAREIEPGIFRADRPCQLLSSINLMPTTKTMSA